MTDTLTRKEIEAIGQAVNKPASTIYRWRQDNPALFEAVYDYAVNQGLEPIAQSDQPVTTPPRRLRAIATRYRSEKPGHEGGAVLIWNGVAYGWKNALRDPRSERPGAYAVDVCGQVLMAVGGNEYEGAERWEVVSESNV